VIKQDLRSAGSQNRSAFAVTNHLDFCMIVSTDKWIYAGRYKADPQCRHIVKRRTAFVRRSITNTALSIDFLGLWSG
jgi:hypothetical protein